ncbi:MAG: LysR substrate-binding domain-containing protein [Gammaproteobacteria bacterium]|nr:LysR substrate-binding domain-containing protein [Gammaproteobacteria bacterium]
MNIRDLQYFIAVADYRHFGKAAQRCFVSQPTLSGQLKKLEEELGAILFERTNRSVEITPIGELLLRHAREIMEKVDAMQQLAMAHQDPLAGPLRIGAIPTLSPYLIPLIISPLQQQFPQLKLVLSEELTDVLLERLRNHEIDAALLATDVDDQEFDTTALFDEPFWIAYPRKHAFYTSDKITARDLKGENILLLAEGHCLADQAMAMFHMEDRTRGGDFADLRAASLETLIQMVRAGFGLTVVPALAMQASWTTGSGVVAQQLSIRNASRRISLVTRRSFPRKQALQALCKVIADHLPNTVHIVFP